MSEHSNLQASASADKQTTTIAAGSDLVVAANEYDVTDSTNQNFSAANSDWTGLAVDFKQRNGCCHISGTNYTLRLEDSLDASHCVMATLEFNGLGPTPLDETTKLCFNAPAHGAATLRLGMANRPISSIMKYQQNNKAIFLTLYPRSCTLQVTGNDIIAVRGQFDLVERAYSLETDSFMFDRRVSGGGMPFSSPRYLVSERRPFESR